MLQHSENTPAMAQHLQSLWHITAALGHGRLGPMALHMADDRHLAAQVAIRSGGLTTDQIHAVDFGTLGTFLRGVLTRMQGEGRGRALAQGPDARHDMESQHDEP